MIRSAVCLGFAAALFFIAGGQANADDKQVARGKYLATVGGCTDCHTPGHFLGKEDATRYLGGSDVGFEIPGLGVFVGPNLTPDKATGLGNWSAKQIVTALKTGNRPDGRQLVPIMPYMNLSVLTNSDAYAIAAFLKSLPPVSHKVAGPFGPSEKPTVFVMKVERGEGMPPLPPAPAPAPGQQK
jgi:mono/diheme cytochrome c family protein